MQTITAVFGKGEEKKVKRKNKTLFEFVFGNKNERNVCALKIVSENISFIGNFFDF